MDSGYNPIVEKHGIHGSRRCKEEVDKVVEELNFFFSSDLSGVVSTKYFSTIIFGRSYQVLVSVDSSEFHTKEYILCYDAGVPTNVRESQAYYHIKYLHIEKIAMVTTSGIYLFSECSEEYIGSFSRLSLGRLLERFRKDNLGTMELFHDLASC